MMHAQIVLERAEERAHAAEETARAFATSACSALENETHDTAAPRRWQSLPSQLSPFSEAYLVCYRNTPRVN